MQTEFSPVNLVECVSAWRMEELEDNIKIYFGLKWEGVLSRPTSFVQCQMASGVQL
jgi:hypothetical protein